MSETKAAHTPGPWSYWPGVAYAQGVVTRDRTAGHVAVPVEMPEDGVMIANAHLIAAAPDLLAACERIHQELLDGELPSAEALDMIEAAIAKARGE